MTISAVINSYADYPKSKTESLLNVKPHDVINHQSQQKRTWQITAAVIYALAAAALASLAILAILALLSATAAVSIFALPAFVPLAIGVLAGVSSIALAALVVKNSIYASKNLNKVVEHKIASEIKKSVELAGNKQLVPGCQVTLIEFLGLLSTGSQTLLKPETVQFNKNQQSIMLDQAGVYIFEFLIKDSYAWKSKNKASKENPQVDAEFSLYFNETKLTNFSLPVEEQKEYVTDTKEFLVTVQAPGAIQLKSDNAWISFSDVKVTVKKVQSIN